MMESDSLTADSQAPDYRTTDSYLSSPSVTTPLTLTTGDDFTVTLSVTPAMNSPESQVICPRAYSMSSSLF